MGPRISQPALGVRRWALHLHCHPGTTWTETGARQGRSGDGNHRSCGKSPGRELVFITLVLNTFGKVRLTLRGAKMSFFRSIGLISMAATILLAQSPDQTRVKEATLKKSL